jgi:MFS family permease
VTRPGWLHPTIVSAALLAVLSGAAQFGVTAVFGDVAVAFGEATESEVAATVGLSATTIGLGLAAIRLAGGLSLFGASLADRLGRRRVLIGAIVAGLLLTLAATATPTYWAFVAVIALSRPALSTVNALTIVVAAEESHARDRTWAIAFVGAAYAVGSGIVSILRGVVDIGFRETLGLAALPVVLVPLLARRLEEPPVSEHAVVEHVGAPARRQRLGAVPRELAGRLALASLLIGSIGWLTGPVFTYLFVYGENVLGTSSGAMAVLVLLAGPTGLVGMLVGRAFADRVGRRVTCAVSTVLVVLSALVMYSGTVPGLSAGYLLVIAASAAFGPASGALLNELVPTAHRATANGWVTLTGVLSAVAGLVAFGALADRVGGFHTAALVMFLPMTPLVLVYRRLPETLGVELETLDVAEVPDGPA